MFVALLGAAVAGAFAAGVVPSSGPDRGTGPQASVAPALLDCVESTQQVPSQCVEQTLIDHMHEHERPVAELVAEIDVLSEQLINAGLDCHSALHGAGEALGAQHGSDALLRDMGQCQGGYYHGVLLTQELDDIVELCSEEQFDQEDDILNCWHGAGHAAWEKYADVAAAQTVCADDTGTRRGICLNGLFMELAHSYQRDPALLDYCLDTDDQQLQQSCLEGAVADVATQRPEDAFDWCVTSGLAHEREQFCVEQAGSGTGAYIAQRDDGGPLADQVPSVCTDEPACAAGIVGGFSTMTRDGDRSREYCDTLTDGTYRMHCHDTLAGINLR